MMNMKVKKTKVKIRNLQKIIIALAAIGILYLGYGLHFYFSNLNYSKGFCDRTKSAIGKVNEQGQYRPGIYHGSVEFNEKECRQNLPKFDPLQAIFMSVFWFPLMYAHRGGLN